MSKKTVKNARKQSIVSEEIVRKEYRFSLEGIPLTFNLRNDIPSELKIWLRLLDTARKVVIADIKKLEKKS